MLRPIGIAILFALLLFGCTDSVDLGTPIDTPDGDMETDAEETPPDGDTQADGDTPTDGDQASDGDVVSDGDTPTDGDEDASDWCENARPLVCGDRVQHNTNTQGREDAWGGYSCTARAESGRETLYALSFEQACQVTISLSDLAADLDILLLDACDPMSCSKASSTPFTEDESLEITVTSGDEYYLVVDGYAEAYGEYTLDIACTCLSDGDVDGDADTDTDGDADLDGEICTDGCMTDSGCYQFGDINPTMPCQYCDPDSNAHGWTPRPANTVCREADGACDLAEVCDGVDGNCPLDVADTGAVCDDGDPCTYDTVCQSDKTCSGVTYDCGAHGTCNENDNICTCPAPYLGDYCESCEAGYVRWRGDCVQGYAPGAGELVITEFMVHTMMPPDTAEWIEISNPSWTVYNLDGCVLRDNDGESHTISNLWALPKRQTVLAASGNSAENHGLDPDYVYGTDIVLDRSPGDEIVLECNSIVVDAVSYLQADVTDNQATKLSPESTDASANDDMANWCSETDRTYGDQTQNGSPGSANPPCGAVDTVFAFVPAGEFWMGSPEDEIGHFGDQGLHFVRLTYDYEIMRTEVTQSDFETLMGYNPSAFSACGADCPVEQVNWHEAAAYANALSEDQALATCYTCSGTAPAVTCTLNSAYSEPKDCPGYRLPSEAEWEYAARAGSDTLLYTGEPLADWYDNCATSSELDPIAWYCGNAGSTSHPVAAKMANNWGLYDTSGNVWEWVWDWYRIDYPHSDYDDPAINPLGPGAQVEDFGKANRGGGWFSDAWTCTSAARAQNTQEQRSSDVGFRLVRSLLE